MTRVTFVSYDDLPAEGGQGVELDGMRRSLAGHDVEITTVSGRGEHRVEFPRASGRAPLDFSLYVNRHPELLQRSQPDVIHALGGPGGVLVTRRFDRPVVYTANHTYRQAYPRLGARRPLALLEARAYRRAARVLAISASTAEAVRRLGVAANRIEVLAPGVDIPSSLDTSLRDPGLLLFVGRWEYEKGVIDAMEVMTALGNRLPGVHGCVVGSGSLETEVRRRAALAKASVEVMGRVSDEALRLWYQRAAVVLMPSRYEGLGLVAAEAMANGALVAGYDVSGLRDLVPPSGGGTLVSHGALAALAAATAGLLGPARDEAAAAARAWVGEHHSWSKVGARLAQVYSEVR